jgi:hypothetical protein
MHEGRDSLGSAPLVKSWGEIRDPRTMFCLDLAHLLRQWKADRDEIILMGDFNKNIYSGRIADLMVASNDLNLHEVCQWTTGQSLPPTHVQGQLPIDAIF